MEVRNERILIVDDMETVRKALRDALAILKFVDLTEAVDGNDAFSKMTEAVAFNRPFQLIFLDLNMPKMSGIELIEKCRALKHFNDTAIIMISTERDKAVVQQAVKAGADDYVLKSFLIEPLAEKIADSLAKKITPAIPARSS